jgi:hypothetical protein
MARRARVKETDMPPAVKAAKEAATVLERGETVEGWTHQWRWIMEWSDEKI